MLRIPRTALLTTFALAIGASGCAENESSLFIEGVLSLSTSDCVARPDAQAEFLAQGVLDYAFAEGYVAAVQVGNQLTQQGNRDKIRTETSRIHLQGVTGSVFDVGGGETDFEAIGTGFVHPAAGTTPGLAAMFVNLVDADSLSAIEAGGEGLIVVRFRVYGTTLGGKEIESGDFDYPIFVCNGCLVNYPASAYDPASPVGTYLCGQTVETTTEEEKICFYGQDQRFSCSACAGFDPICRDPTLNPWNQ
jgi:hypothetical protein